MALSPESLLDALRDIALPSAFAGLVAIMATMVVERLGGIAGGVLSSIPTTIVPAAIGIFHRSASVDDFRRSMAFVPVGILLNAGFLVLWRVVPARVGRRTRSHLLAWTLAITLFAWLAAAGSVVWIHDTLRPTVASALATGCTAFVAGIALGIAANRTPHPAPKGTHRVPATILALRGLAAAAVIGGAILLSRSGLPVASGIASVFPVIFTTIMVATWLAQGAHVPTGAVGPMALGTLSVSAYALLATWLFPIMPLWAAATLCWIAAVAAVSVPAFLFLRRTRARAQARSVAASGAG
ncbi:MAG: hypothetical protein ACKOYN_11200 [Planctomycetota bacterium]